MKYFGTWKVGAVDGNDDLWILDNPCGPDVWGAELDDGKEVVPCDGFVFDLSSSPSLLWFIYPKTTAKKPATIHDWIRHCHVSTEEQILEELKPWFHWIGFTQEDSVAYVKWIKSITYRQWNQIYYHLSGLQKDIPQWKRSAAFGLLMTFGWIPWSILKPSKKTALYRAGVKMGALRCMKLTSGGPK